jgi:transposase
MVEDRFPRICGSGRDESGPAATAVASTPTGADAYTHHESAACGGSERRSTAKESIVAARRVAANWNHWSWHPGPSDGGKTCSIDLLDQLTPKIQELTRALEEEVENRPAARRLMTQPGVGVLTALAFELVIGTPDRFHCGKQIASYVGLVPTEESSEDRRRVGHISKQDNSLLRFLLVEAAQATVRSQSQWRNKFFHLACAEDERSRRSRWPASWRFVCTGCGTRDGITSSGKSSVRTRDSPEIAMVCSRTPRN